MAGSCVPELDQAQAVLEEELQLGPRPQAPGQVQHAPRRRGPRRAGRAARGTSRRRRRRDRWCAGRRRQVVRSQRHDRTTVVTHAPPERGELVDPRGPGRWVPGHGGSPYWPARAATGPGARRRARRPEMPTVGAGGGCRGLSEVPGAGRPCHASACRSDRPPRTEPSREPRPRSPRAAADPRREGQPHRRCRRVVDGGRRARRAAVGVRDRRAQRRSRSVAARPRGGRGHLDRRLPAVRRRARGHLGRRPRRAGRGRARRRGAHQGEPRAAGPDGQPPPVAAGRTQLRVLLRGSPAGRPAGGRVREGRAVAGRGHDRQALRRQRVRDRADDAPTR